MKKLHHILLTALLLLPCSVRGDETVKRPVTYVPPATLTIQSGVPLSGTWDFTSSGTVVLALSSFRLVDTTNANQWVTFNISGVATGGHDVFIAGGNQSSTVQPWMGNTHEFVTYVGPTGAQNHARPVIGDLTDLSGASKLIGSSATGATVGEITLGTNLSMSGSTLNATGGSGSPAGAVTNVQYHDSGDVFGGDANFAWDKTLHILSLGSNGVSGALNLYSGNTTRALALLPSSSLASSVNFIFPRTSTDLDSTGGTGYVLKQNTLGGAITSGLVSTSNMSALSGVSKLLGSPSTGSGVGEITLGTNLSMSNNTLNASGGGSPGGNNGEVQYNNNGVLGGISEITSNGSFLFLIDGKTTFKNATDPTKTAQLDLSQLPTSGAAVLKIPNAVVTTAVIPDTGASNNFLTALGSNGTFSKARPTISNLTDLGATSKLVGSNASSAAVTEITLGSGLGMTGSTLNVTAGGGNVSNSGTPTLDQIAQWTDATHIKGITTIPDANLPTTMDGHTFTNATITNGSSLDEQVGYVLADSAGKFVNQTDPSKQFQFNASNISSSNMRTVTIPDAGSVTVVPDTGASNQFLTAISALGAISKAQPSFSNLSGNYTLAQGPSITASKLLGRGDSGAGVPQELTLGTNLSISGTTLNATSGGGGNVSNSGTPASPQLAQWTDATHIQGVTPTAPITASAGAIGLNVGVDHAFTAAQSVTLTPAANTAVNGLSLIDPTTASSGNQQYSPFYHMSAQGFYTALSPQTRTEEWRIGVVPVDGVSGMSVAQSRLTFQRRDNGGTWAEAFTIDADGNLFPTAIGDSNIIRASVWALDTVGTGGDGSHLKKTSLTNDGLHNNTSGLKLSAGSEIAWSDNANLEATNGFPFGLGLSREAQGVLSITDGASIAEGGAYRDLKARNVAIQTGGAVTGSGSVPTGGTTSQVLQKNSNTNYDVGWTTLSGGGNVSNSGTPTNGQTAVWTDATHIQGKTTLAGGTTNQVLSKSSNTDYDYAWTTAAGGGNVSNSGTPTNGQIAQWTDATHIQGISTISTSNIGDGQVTYGKMQAASASSKLIGSPSTGTALQEITLGTNLSMSNGTLNAAGGGGSPGGSQYSAQVNDGASGFTGDSTFTYNYGATIPFVSIPNGDPIAGGVPANAMPGLRFGTTNQVGFANRDGSIYIMARINSGNNIMRIVGNGNYQMIMNGAGQYGWAAAEVGDNWSDTGLIRNAAGVVKVTDGSSGTGTIIGNGTVPTGGTTNQVLAKASNTNYDLTWATPAGGGNVSNSGTPTADQVAVWTDSTHIKGTTTQVLSDGSVDSRVSDTNSGVSSALTIGHENTSQIGSAGTGTRLQMNIEDSTTVAQPAALIESMWSTSTHGSNVSDLYLYLDNGSATPSLAATLNANKFWNMPSGGGYKINGTELKDVAETLTNKAITKRVTSITSNATWAPTASMDCYKITAQTAGVTTISSPGAGTDMQVLEIRYYSASAQSISGWATGTNGYRFSSDLAAPTTTSAGKVGKLLFQYDSTDQKWDLMAKIDNF